MSRGHTSAAGGAEMVSRGIVGNSCGGPRASAAEGTDQAVLHALEEFVFGLAGLVFASGFLVGRSCGCRRGLGGLDGFRLALRLGLRKCCVQRAKRTYS